VHVEAGSLQILGALLGTLDVQGGAAVVIVGVQQGTVAIAGGAMVTVRGSLQGTVSLAHGATLVVEASAKLAGSLANDGVVILRGVFGGVLSGNGQLRLEGNRYIKQPVLRNGISCYEW
jgi:cytoskeletal protein CcmA (bactofilin family)